MTNDDVNDDDEGQMVSLLISFQTDRPIGTQINASCLYPSTGADVGPMGCGDRTAPQRARIETSEMSA